MRDILFRGKRLDNGEWVEGFLVRTTLCSTIIVNEVEEYSCGCCIGIGSANFEVDPSTVGQYTGLKDKNGERIWEGDVVRCGTGRICKVTFFISPGFSGFDLVPVVGFYAPPPNKWLLFADTDIAGNIHDNQELLEGGASE